MKIVIDSSPLIFLSKIGKIELLSNLYAGRQVTTGKMESMLKTSSTTTRPMATKPE